VGEGFEENIEPKEMVRVGMSKNGRGRLGKERRKLRERGENGLGPCPKGLVCRALRGYRAGEGTVNSLSRIKLAIVQRTN